MIRLSRFKIGDIVYTIHKGKIKQCKIVSSYIPNCSRKSNRKLVHNMEIISNISPSIYISNYERYLFRNEAELIKKLYKW